MLWIDCQPFIEAALSEVFGIHFFVQPKEQVIITRKKYDLWLEDREKQIIDKYGQSFDIHKCPKTFEDRTPQR